jgi:hypothetical protein
MYITLGLLGFLAHAVGSQEVLIGDAANALGIAFIALIAILWIVMMTAIGIEAIWAKLNSDPRNFAERWMEGRVLLLTIALGVLGGVAVAFHIVVRLELPVLPIFLVVAAAAFAFLQFSQILAEAFMQYAQLPRGLKRWIDLYASLDPVPNGPTRVKPGQAEVESVETETDAQKQNCLFLPTEIHNRGSILTDHTIYWENFDGFVLRVLHACAETAGSPWRSELPAATAAEDRRAKWRVNHLQPGRWVLNLGSLAAFALLWGRFGDSAPLLFGLPEWARPFDLAIPVLVAWIAAGLVLHLAWRRWVRSEQEQVLRGKPPGRAPWRPFFLMGSVLGLILLAVAAAGLADTSLLQRPTMELTGLFLVFIAAGVGIEVSMRWLLPPPNNDVPGRRVTSA